MPICSPEHFSRFDPKIKEREGKREAHFHVIHFRLALYGLTPRLAASHTRQSARADAAPRNPAQRADGEGLAPLRAGALGVEVSGR